MLSFLLSLSGVKFCNSLVTKADTMCWIFYRVEPQLFHNCQQLCQHWCFIYWFLISCMVNNWPSIFITLLRCRTSLLQHARTLNIFHLLRLYFRVDLSKIGMNASEKMCMKHEIFLFQKWKKGIYIRLYMPY